MMQFCQTPRRAIVQGTAFAVLAGSLLAALPARAADEVASVFNPAPVAGWIVSIGGTVQLGPKYEGANSAGIAFMPSFNLRRANEPAKFSAPDDGLDYAVIETGRFSLGPVANFRPGRYGQSLPQLRGLRDVPWTIEAGVFAEYWVIPDRFRTRLEVRQGFHGHHGVMADLSADWVEKVGRFTFSTGPRLSLGNGRALNRYFGVSADEAVLTGLPAYRAKGGVKSAGWSAALAYEWSSAMTTTVFTRYDRMLADAARSPIVRHSGQRDQFTVGLSAVYSFTVKD